MMKDQSRPAVNVTIQHIQQTGYRDSGAQKRGVTVEQQLHKPNQRLYQHNDDYTATKYYGRPLGDVFEPASDGTKNEKAWGRATV